MSSWISSIASAITGSNEEEEKAKEAEAEATLDKDEIRRRRLATLMSGGAGTEPPSTAPLASALPKSEYAPTFEPQSSSPSVAKKPGRSNEDSQPLSKKLNTSSIERGASENSAVGVVAPDGNMYARTISSSLEGIFNFTLRKDADKSFKYYGSICTDVFLNAMNLSGIVCAHISGELDGGAMPYLYGTYKRLQAKLSVVSNEAVKEELLKCRNQLVSFIVSALSAPAAFGPSCENSTRDLVRIIGAEPSVSVTDIIKAISDELDVQGCFDDVAMELFKICFNGLDVSIPPNPRTIEDSNQVYLSAVSNFCVCDKRFARSVVFCPFFSFESHMAAPRSPTYDERMQAGGANRMIEWLGHAGAALEHNTLLGRILRISVDARDPIVQQNYSDIHRHTKVSVEQKINGFRSTSLNALNKASDVVLALVKAGSPAKEVVISWLTDSLIQNKEATKGHPNPLACSSAGMLGNLAGLALRLCKPYLNDREKLRKVNWAFLVHRDSLDIFPRDETRLASLPACASEQMTHEGEFNFITVSFFVCWRAFSIGFVTQYSQYLNHLRRLNHFHAALMNNEPHAVDALVRKVVSDTILLTPEFLESAVAYCSSASLCLIDALNCFDFDPQNNLTDRQRAILAALPEHLIDDVAETFLFIAKTEPSYLSAKPLDSLLKMTMFFLRRPWAVKSPHLRAKFGQLIMFVFLPSEELVNSERWSSNLPTNGPHRFLLDNLAEAASFLAPALLLLYGDVEKTGYQEKISHRRCILTVLKYIWKLSSHRGAFRSIAQISVSSSAGSQTDDTSDYFIRFANGLLNETNALVISTIEKLQEIKKIQTQMQNPQAWAAISEEDRSQSKDRLQAAEEHVKAYAGLCHETVHMVNLLTSDAIILQRFLSGELLPRVASMVLHMLRNLVGSKSLDIKVDHMEQYGFDPKRMLQDVCITLAHFSVSEEFRKETVSNGYYDGGLPLQKAVSTVSKLKILNSDDFVLLSAFLDGVKATEKDVISLSSLSSEAPEEFLDQLLYTIMRDPVQLPTSGNILDRLTISQHLLNDETDPFNRQPLNMSMVEPLPDLKMRIDEWLIEKGFRD